MGRDKYFIIIETKRILVLILFLATRAIGIGKKYTTTRIKSRKFLSNIAYVGVNKEDYYNKNFIFDVYLLLTKNLNLFSLNRKLADKTKHEMIYMLWKECMLSEFYRHVCLEKRLSVLEW